MLPKIDLPIFETLLPSTGEKVQYRAMTVKEEKILLVAQEAQEVGANILAIKQVVNNCLLNIEVDKIAMFDLEYLLMHIRSRSIDNEIGFTITDPETEEEVKLEFKIEDIKLEFNDEHSNQVPINDEYSLFLKYPTIDEFIRIATLEQDDPLVNYTIMLACLDKVASNDEVHDFKNYSQQEVNDFMENVDTKVIKGIQRFFDTMPKLKHIIPYTNKNGDEKSFEVEGINSFFF